MKHCYRKYIGAIILILVCHSGLPAQNAPDIREIQAFVKGDSLKVEFACPNLFSGTIRKTLLSGLPVLLELQPQLSDNKGGKYPQPVFKWRLSYDIWEDRFMMDSPEERRLFSSLDQLQNYWNPREEIGLIPLNELRNKDGLQLGLSMQIFLLSRNQAQRLKDWIFNPNEVEENLPSQERDTGFKLNLNRVVSLFLNKTDIIESYEFQAQTGEFDIDALPLK